MGARSCKPRKQQNHVTESLNDSKFLDETERRKSDSDETENKQMGQTMNPIARVILQGLCDENCVLRKLNGIPHVLQIVWNYVKSHWKEYIVVAQDTPPVYWIKDEEYFRNFTYHDTVGGGYCSKRITFPPPTGLNINMMPFIMETKFKSCRLPKHLKTYWENLIQHCYQTTERGKVCFLTIQESFVKCGASQRRPGLHIETPGTIAIAQSSDNIVDCLRKTSTRGNGVAHFPVVWGRGNAFGDKNFYGGIYMASTVDESCKVWNCQIIPDKNGNEIIGHLGDIGHLRALLPESTVMEKNTLHWITDRTPHESLSLKEGTYRQFFRVVMSEVSVWYEEHSTKNPLGVVPDPKMTRIVKGSKFGGNIVFCD